MRTVDHPANSTAEKCRYVFTSDKISCWDALSNNKWRWWMWFTSWLIGGFGVSY